MKGLLKLMDRTIRHFRVTKLSKKDKIKIDRDLQFIELMINAAREFDYRVVVSGGYASDGNLGKITRPHGDVDLLIFGMKIDPPAINQLLEKISDENLYFRDLKLIDKGRKEYYHSLVCKREGFYADIYCIETFGNPLEKLYQVVKKDGTIAATQVMDTVRVRLNTVSFEAQTALSGLVDRLIKRKRGDEIKKAHSQDIENLKLVTDPIEVKKILSE